MRSKSIRLIWIIVFFIVILSISGIFLYMKKDLFRPKRFYFEKYFSENIQNVVNLFDFSKQSEISNKVSKNDFTETTNINVKFIENEEEEKFTIKEKGIVNNSEKKSYRKIRCNSNDKNIIDVELLHKNEIYGIRLTNLIKQFVSVENKNIPNLASKLGYNEEYVEDKLNLDNIDLFSLINFSDEELNNLKEKYSKLIFDGLDNKSYTSNSNALITLNNGESVNTKVYILTVNKNELDNMGRRIIKQAIDDEIILNKINKIDNNISDFGIKAKNNIKDIYKTKLQEIYDSIEYKGEDDRKIVISVYKQNDKVVRTLIKTEIYEFYIDKDTKNENAMSLKIVKLTSEGTDTKTFILENNDVLEFTYDNNSEKSISVKITDKDEGNNLKIITNLDYKNSKLPDINVICDTKYEFEKKEDIDIEFEENKNFIINKYDKKTIQSISDSLEKIIINKLQESQEKTNSKALEIIIKFINDEYKEKNDAIKEEVEEKKKNFNNMFLLFEGKKIEYENIKKLINIAGKNMREYKITEDNDIIIYIEEDKENNQKADEILNLLKEKDLYNVELNYSENGIVEKIKLSTFKEKQEV